MATMQVPGTGLGVEDLGSRSRRWAVIAAVFLAFLAIVVPFVVDAMHDHGRAATTATQTAPRTAPTASPSPHGTTGPSSDSSLGARGGLPSLLPAQAPRLADGQPVRVGDVTTGTVHRSAAGWQVLVRWDGRLQALPTRGPLSFGPGTWVARSGLLYTRVSTGTPGRFQVYAWHPIGGSAYTPPTLVATSVGDVCFDRTFTGFGGCPQG